MGNWGYNRTYMSCNPTYKCIRGPPCTNTSGDVFWTPKRPILRCLEEHLLTRYECKTSDKPLEVQDYQNYSPQFGMIKIPY